MSVATGWSRRGPSWWALVALISIACGLAAGVAGWLLWPDAVRAGWETVERAAVLATVATASASAVGVTIRLTARVRERIVAARWSRMPRGVHVWGRVPPQAGWYQPRAVATRLTEAGRLGRTAVLTHVLTGMGGVGKTQLAAWFVRYLVAHREVGLVIWINATAQDAIVAGYAGAATDLHLVSRGGDALQIATRLLTWLEGTSRRWLVVLDDLTEPGHLSGWWPPQSPRGRVLVTTRRRDAVLRSMERTVLDVSLFTPAEARAYLVQALPGHQPSRDVDRLAADLGHLPVALAQAAAYTRDRGLTCEQYRQRLADRRRRLGDLLPEEQALPDEQRATVAAAWWLSIDIADQFKPELLARPVLHLACLLDPNNVPLELFITEAVRRYVATVTGHPASSSDIRDALWNLHRLHLLTVDPAGHAGEGQVRMHAMVQRATRDRLTEAVARQTAHTAADALLELWPDLERDPNLSSTLRANASALYRHSDDALLLAPAHRVLFRVGESLGDSGQTRAAVDYYQGVLTDCIRVLDPDHSRALSLRHNLAHWRGRSGDAAGAVAAFEALLADRLRVLGPDHADTLRARGALADRRGYQGYASVAKAAFEALLADRIRILGPDHHDTLCARGNAARWQGQAGDVPGAVAALAALVPEMIRVLGPDHLDTLRVRNNLAHLQGRTGDEARAVAEFEPLLADQVRLLGRTHLNTLRVRINLAYWLGEAGEVAGAVAALTALIPDLIQVLGPDHPDTVHARRNLASLRGGTHHVVDDVDALEALVPELARVGGQD